MENNVNATTVVQAINNLNNTLISMDHTLWFIALWLALMLFFKEMSSDCNCNQND